METKYLIIQSDSLENAKLRLKTLIQGLGYSDANYKYIIGESNIGYANSTVIRNNTILTDWGNGNFLFKFDCNIVEQYGVDIELECEKYSDIFWCVNKCGCDLSTFKCTCGADPCTCDIPECTCDFVRDYMPTMEII